MLVAREEYRRTLIERLTIIEEREIFETQLKTICREIYMKFVLLNTELQFNM